MPLHVIVVDRVKDFSWTAPDRVIMAARDFVRESARRLPASARVVNLCRDYSYLSHGYYCSLLAEARGQRVIPSVEVMLDLHWKRLLGIALPEVKELVRKTFRASPGSGDGLSIDVFFGEADDARLAQVARRVFELFRCPLLTLDLRYRSGWDLTSVEPMSIHDLEPGQEPLFKAALDRYTHAQWKPQRAVQSARYSIAILHDPQERQPPSNPRALERFVRAGTQAGVEVELITRADYGRLTEYDALFIRETTALNHHTYRFAKKAEAEGMAVIDDPRSIMKCTNKVCLAELLEANSLPAPRTLIVDRRGLARATAILGFPLVLKMPDSSFSRGVFKVANQIELESCADKVFKASDLIIAQEYMETPYDWRVGVLEGKPLYVCQYFMARGHWQIIKYNRGERYIAGGCTTLAVENAPAAVIDVAVQAANLFGDGFYGVDLKETADGVFVIEVNDNPSIDAGVEDGVLKDDLYAAVIQTFIRRLDRKAQQEPKVVRLPRRKRA